MLVYSSDVLVYSSDVVDSSVDVTVTVLLGTMMVTTPPLLGVMVVNALYVKSVSVELEL